MAHHIEQIEERAALATWHPPSVALLLGGCFTLFGVLVGSQGVLWAEVIRRLGIGEGTFGTVQLLSPLVAVVVLLWSGQLSLRMGKKALSLIGVALLLASCLALAAVSNLAGLVGMLLVAGTGNGLFEAGMNGAALDWERARGRGMMNTMHACFSGGAVVGALATGKLLDIGLTYAGVMLIVAALYSLALLLSLPVTFPPSDTLANETASLAVTLRLIGGNRILLALAVICMLSVFGEGVAGTWSVIYLRDELGAAAVVGGVAFAFFNGAMFVGRLANEYLVARLGARASLLISGGAMVLASALLVLSSGVFLATLGFILLGLGVAGVVPTVLTAAAQSSPGNSGTITGGIMATAYASFVFGAPLIGWLAELSSLRLSFLTLLLAGAILMILAGGSVKNVKRKM